MPNSSPNFPNNYLFPLYMNGLQGQMLYSPAKNNAKREFLFVYDYHNSLDQWQEFIKVLNRFGAVTSADLPGFGGMQSFYKIHEKPTIDTLADYLASFIKLRYRKRAFTILAVGYGFAIVTRMLQRYPEIARRIPLVVSIGGVAHRDDLLLKSGQKQALSLMTWAMSQRLPAWLIKSAFVRASAISWAETNTSFYKNLSGQKKSEKEQAYLDQSVLQWQKNDFRTYLSQMTEIFRLDNCKHKVGASLWHVALQSRNIDNQVVEQHLRVIYKDYHQLNVSLDLRETRVLNAKIANRLLPIRLKRQLSKPI